MELLARVSGAAEMLAPGLNPFDRAADPERCQSNDELFGIDVLFDAEAAADVRRNHPHRCFRQLQHVAKRAAQCVRPLGRRPDG